LHFNKNNSNGFAAYHDRCFKNHIPNTRSENDPFRGSGTFKIPDHDDSTHVLLVDKGDIETNVNDDTLKEFFNHQNGLIKKLLK